MDKKTKALIAAILALLLSSFGAYVALSDDDLDTNPDYAEIVEDVGDVVDAASEMKESGEATEKAARETAEAAKKAAESINNDND